MSDNSSAIQSTASSTSSRKRAGRRAVNEAQKAQRRADILDSARALFNQSAHYEDILMKHIAENIALTKGTLYLYFKTKEEVFLALYEEEFLALCQRLRIALSGAPPQTEVSQLHAIICGAMLGYPTFLRLNSMLHAVLERNIEFETALRFKSLLRDQMLETAEQLEEKVKGLSSGQGAELLLLVHEITIGAYHTSSPSPCLDLVFERPDMQFMKLDFETEFPKLLKYLLQGYLQSKS
ncbi:MAG: hypothetical protein C9356_03130 [Oleiphilus sp.]|nr:MAG: hypothetical protein C9356_03130 [Oleiphilus sp.]